MRARDPQRELGDEQARPFGVAERPVVVMTPGNAGRAKGPWVKVNARSGARAVRLAMNETKTRLCRVPDESFDFLGYTIVRPAFG